MSLYEPIKSAIKLRLRMMGFDPSDVMISIPIGAFWTALEGTLLTLDIPSGEDKMDLDTKEGYVVLFNRCFYEHHDRVVGYVMNLDFEAAKKFPTYSEAAMVAREVNAKAQVMYYKVEDV